MKLAVLLAMLAFQLAGAAPTKREVTGTVKDKFGNSLPGAAVEIENAQTLAVASYITRNDGHYYFSDLSTDVDYTLRAKYRNLWSKPRLLNKFDGGERVTIDLEIPTK